MTPAACLLPGPLTSPHPHRMPAPGTPHLTPTACLLPDPPHPSPLLHTCSLDPPPLTPAARVGARPFFLHSSALGRWPCMSVSARVNECKPDVQACMCEHELSVCEQVHVCLRECAQQSASPRACARQAGPAPSASSAWGGLTVPVRPAQLGRPVIGQGLGAASWAGSTESRG